MVYEAPYEIPYSQPYDPARHTAIWGWCIISGMVVLFALARVVRIVRRRTLVKHAAKEIARREAQTPTRRIEPRRLFSAAKSWGNKTFSIRTLRVYIYRSPAVGEIIWTAGYIVVLTSLTLGHAHLHGIWNYQDAMGYMVFAQFPLIIGLAGKNNVFSFLTGISYERLNFLHRTAGRMAVLWAWIHALGRIKLGLVAPHNFGSKYITGAIFALSAFTVLIVTAERPIRKNYYEVFIVTHIISVLVTIIGAWIHHPEVAGWIWAGLIIWSLDRIVSFGRWIYNNQMWLHLRGFRESTRGKIELLSGDVLRLTLPAKRMSWTPGQHAFISCQYLGGFTIERHPFSILNLPQPGAKEQEISFLLRVQNGFTKRVRDSLDSQTQTVPIFVEGPYGTTHRLDTYDTVILIAGGIGITYAISHLLGVLRAIRAEKCLVRRIRLVWCTKNLHDIEWITPVLEDAFADQIPTDIKVEVDIHITQSSKADDPDVESPIVETRTPSISESHEMTPHPESAIPLALLGAPVSRLGAAADSPPLKIEINADPLAGLLPRFPAPPHISAWAPSSPPPTHPVSIAAPVPLHPLQPKLEDSESRISPPSLAPVLPLSPTLRTEKLMSIASDVTLVRDNLPRPLGELGPCLAPYTRIRRVRAALGDVLEKDFNEAKGPIHVSVCGPLALANVVRKEVKQRMNPLKVLRGEQHEIELRCESQGW